jgi:hypothetical protein
MEGAHQIFSRRQIDADFAADRTIHLRQQRGRRLHKRDAAQIRGGDKSRQIAHHAAAQSHDEGFSFQAMAGQPIAAGLEQF